MTRPSTARIVGLGLLVAFAATSTSVLPAAPSFASVVWAQVGADIDGEAASDLSGVSVSFSGDGTTVAIGAPYNDGNGVDAGQVRVYTFAGGGWDQLGGDINGEAASDLSGLSVSLSSDGRTVAIGALLNDGNGVDAGQVRVYTFAGGAWTQLGGDINGEAASDVSGYSVSLSSNGTTVAIGAPYNDGNGANAGQVRIYTFAGGAWTQLGGDINGEAASDESGFSVSLSSNGTTVAIGARFNGVNAGQVRVYTFAGGAWVQVGGDIDGEAANDFLGGSVSLSADGSRVAIGAPLNDGNGVNAGQVRIYTFAGGAWTQLGGDINGEAASDESGYSVSLSSDGTTVAIGALFNDGNGVDAGQVRIYSSTAPNVSPVFSSGTAGSGVAGVASSVYTAAASDADNDTVTYTLGSAVAGFTINSSTGVVSMAASVAAGSHVLTVVASDGTASATQTVTVTVTAASAPSADAGLALDRSVGQPIAGAGVDYFVDGLQVGSTWALTLRSTPQIIASGIVDGSGAVRGTAVIPAGLAAGWHSITMTGTDILGTAVNEVLWFELNGSGVVAAKQNTAPVLPAAVLARTGSDIGGLLTGALALLMLGLVAVAFTRRQEKGLLAS